MGIDVEPTHITWLTSDRGLTRLRVVAQDGAFAEQETDLGSVPEPVRRAWSRLSKAAPLSADTYVALLVLLMETAPGACTRRVTRPALAKPTGAYRDEPPSAAHPRAYRGTKYRPPRPKQQIVGPLATFRDNLQSLRTVLNLHAEADREAGLEEMHKLGHTPDDIAWALTSLNEARWYSPALLRCILPSLRGARWSLVRETAALFNALGLDEDASQRSAVARWFAINGAAKAASSLAWLRWLGRCPAEHRRAFAKIVASTTGAAAQIPPDDFVFGDWSCETPNKRLDFALRARLAGMSAAYFRGAFHPDPKDHYSAEEIRRDDPAFDLESTVSLLERLGAYRALYTSVWDACGCLPGLSPALKRLSVALGASPSTKDRDGALCLLELWVSMRWNEVPNLARWADEVFASMPAMLEWMKSFDDEDTRDTAAHILDVSIEQLDTGEQLAQKLPLLMTFVSRLVKARATTKTWIPIEKVVATLEPGQLKRWVDAPAKSHAALTRACRSINESWRIRRGLLSIAEAMPDLFLRAYRQHPRKLMKTALAIGDARLAQRRNTLRRLADCCTSFAELADLRLPGRTNPMPRRLRDHLEDRICLSPGSLARHQRVVAARADLTALDNIRLAVEKELAHGHHLHELTPARAHALRLEGWAEANRRALRRLLAAPSDATGDYVFEHPRAKQWLRQHRSLMSKLTLWRCGISLSGPADGDRLTLTVCQDPLETLRMGTYVGSCLGLGGDFMYTAAAIALDMNKRVVYAKNAAGRVVGRQQLSWTDEGTLVCHTPYPVHASDQLKALFARYDVKFAAALGVKIQDTEEDYTISHVLSSRAYDDGPWHDRPDHSLDHGDDLGVREIGGRSIGLADRGAAEVCAG